MAPVNSFYKIQIPLETRWEDVALAKKWFPHLIPVILENAEKSRCPDMRQKMHFVPYNARVWNFADHIRYMLNLNRAQALFLFATDNSKLLRSDAFMRAVYTENKDKEDRALYITYSDRRLGTQPNLEMAANLSYKQRYSFEQRWAYFNLIIQKYPDMIPVILENAENSQYPDTPRKKCLVPKYELLGDFADRTRFNLNLNHRHPIFLYTTNDGMLIQRNELMSTVYDRNKDEDGALYIEYCDVFSLVQLCML